MIGLVADDFFSLLANSKLHLNKKKEKVTPAPPIQFSLTSDTNFVVPSLNVFSMGVASA